jgi:RHS repeat-associated protein
VFGRLVQVDEQRTASPMAWSTTLYEYDPLDNVKKIIDPEGVITEMTHDFAGRRTQIKRNSRVWTYGYDKNGNLESETMPCTGSGCSMSYTNTIAYDALDRPTSKALAPRNLTTPDLTLFGATSEVFTWDGGTNGKGRLSQWQSFGPTSTTPVTSIVPTYNVAGQVLNLTQTTNAAGYSNLSRLFSRSYELSGALRGISFRNIVGTQTCQHGSSASFYYDSRGLLSQVFLEHCAGQTTNPRSNIFNTRNVAGLVTRRYSAQVSGAITNAESNWTYDKLGRVKSQIISKGSSLEQVVRQDLEYFGNDDPKWMKHWLGPTNMKQFDFGYDLRHQLKTVNAPNAFAATYDYGDAGRFKTAAESHASLPNSDVVPRDVTYVYSSTDPERLLRLRKNPGTTNLAEYTYDAAGNQLTRYYPDTGELWEYVYDGKNQLRRVVKKLNGTVQGSEEYWYDEKNARYLVVKRNNGGTKTGATWFIEDTEAHYNATGTVTRAFGHVSMGTPVARFDRSSDGPSTLEYQFHGLANNTIATIDQPTGTTNTSFMYAPFGEIVEATNAGGSTNGLPWHRRRFNDKYVDEVSGLAYYGFRYYDKLSMTWTQDDPLFQFVPDLTQDVPRRAQLYTFSLNNSLRYLDPDGLDSKSLSSYRSEMEQSAAHRASLEADSSWTVAGCANFSDQCDSMSDDTATTWEEAATRDDNFGPTKPQVI